MFYLHLSLGLSTREGRFSFKCTLLLSCFMYSGTIMASDQTDVLRSKSYWASYNIPWVLRHNKANTVDMRMCPFIVYMQICVWCTSSFALISVATTVTSLRRVVLSRWLSSMVPGLHMMGLPEPRSLPETTHKSQTWRPWLHLWSENSTILHIYIIIFVYVHLIVFVPEG